MYSSTDKTISFFIEKKCMSAHINIKHIKKKHIEVFLVIKQWHVIINDQGLKFLYN